jgi:hypothetical protein
VTATRKRSTTVGEPPPTRQQRFQGLQPSPGRGRGYWLVHSTLGPYTIEVLSYLDPRQYPSEVALVQYGPRGGARVLQGGTVEELRKQKALIDVLIGAGEEVDRW